MKMPTTCEAWATRVSAFVKAATEIHNLPRFPIRIASVAADYSRNVFPKEPITVVDGKITESTFDNVNEAGVKKSEDAEYQANMAEKVGVGPADYFPQLNNQLIETQDPEAVEVVTGATSSTDTFKKYAPMLIEAAEAGDTTTIEIDNAVEE